MERLSSSRHYNVAYLIPVGNIYRPYIDIIRQQTSEYHHPHEVHPCHPEIFLGYYKTLPLSEPTFLSVGKWFILRLYSMINFYHWLYHHLTLLQNSPNNKYLSSCGKFHHHTALIHQVIPVTYVPIFVTSSFTLHEKINHIHNATIIEHNIEICWK